MDFDLHVSAEDAALGRQALFGEQVEKALVQALGNRGWSGLHETGAAALAAVAVQGELRDGEHAATNVEYRAIHFALVIGEDAQVSALFSAEAQRLLVVARAEADEQDQTLADLAVELAIDVDASVADALDEDFHGREWTVIIVITVITVIEMIYRRCELSEVQAFEAWGSSHEFQMYPSPHLCQLRLESPLAALEFELWDVL